MPLSKSEKLKMCAGCKENFYNGHNPYGYQECWNLPTAKVVSKVKVSMDQVPPWSQPPIKVLSCFHEKGYVFVKPDAYCCQKKNYTDKAKV